jgi:two-component sensor histidine kinase
MNYPDLLHSPIIPPPVVPLVEKAARNNAEVLIQGEHGTEKELIAKIIHYAGDWKYYRFYKVECRAQTENSFNDQLLRIFKENNFGAIPATLYLKEIGELNPYCQSMLLELIEDGFFQYGIEKKVIRNLRFIASSSEDLKQKIGQGRFSEDLYDRLNTLSLRVPPLRDRSGEISAIAQYLLNEYSKKTKRNKVGISRNVLKLFQSYWWPGNLRELEQVIVRSAMFSEGEILTEKDLLFETENWNTSFVSFLKKAEVKPGESKPGMFSPERANSTVLSVFLIELVHRIKNPLVSVKTFTQLLREKFGDPEFREQFYRIVTEDIEKIDAVLNGLLSYIKINTPIEKRDTVHFVLEDVLKRYEMQMEDKRIRVFKRFEKDLPETIVHEEQLKYILDTLLQYAIPSVPPNGSMGFLTKSLGRPTGLSADKKTYRKDGTYVEILIVFTGYKRPVEQFENILGVRALQQEEAMELELRLIREIIQRNQGVMRFEVNEKKPRTLISLQFPVERRKLVYYQRNA